MKNLLVLTTLISSLIIPSVAHADWEKTMFGAIQFYIDFEKVRQRNNNYLVWMLMNGDGVKHKNSIAMLFEFDCKALSFRKLGFTAYEKMWAFGDVTSSDRKIWKWEYPHPNSDLEKQTTKLCKKID
jgi:hypothetical protein